MHGCLRVLRAPNYVPGWQKATFQLPRAVLSLTCHLPTPGYYSLGMFGRNTPLLGNPALSGLNRAGKCFDYRSVIGHFDDRLSASL
jgi:hypothetical protein